MNLVLDFGNTRIKAAMFRGQDLIAKHIFESDAELLETLNSFGIKNCVIGSVTKAHEKTSEHLSNKFNTLVFSATTPIPIKNLYKSPLSLGSDRIAASVGSWLYYPGQPVLTIDVGTCIKYNFVNANNQFLGGAIAPGLGMRLKAMNFYTQKLPLVELDKNYDKLTGESTNESILSGALIGSVCEADAMIDRYRLSYANLQVVLTGGDSDYLCKQLKNRFFANQNILLHGLNAILNFNIEK